MPDGNIKWTRDEAVWLCHIHIDVQLLVSAPTLPFFFFKHKPVLYEEELKKKQYHACFKLKPQAVALISANNTSHVFFVLTFFDLKSFEKIWQSMLRELPDAYPRGYMLNCLVFQWRCAAFSSCYFWLDRVPGATWKCTFEKNDTIAQTFLGLMAKC